MLARIGLLALAAAATPSGCEKIFGDGSQNAHMPGTDLGSFSVVANVTSNTCGDGALGEQPSWQFSVHFEMDPGVLYWNNGQEVLTGTLSDDGSFSIDSSVVQNMRDPNVVGPLPCSIVRTDHAAGKFNSAKNPTSFTGQLSYTFSPTSGSTCDDLWMSDAPIVAALPCGFTYQATGTSASASQ
jgi:hypothetical protein